MMQPVMPDPPVITPPVIDLRLEAPGQQRRATVAFRFILAIPAFLWLGLLGWVSQLALLVGWFAALFTGRLPVGIAEFVAKVVRYQVRVTAYGQFLLTDRYPGFSLDTDDYAVEADLPEPGRLNRAAVLFRLVLLVPGAIVSTLVTAGSYPVLLVAWLITVLTGRLPRPLFEAFAAVLRYNTRFYGFAAMLTSEQPKRLFGDGAPPETTPAPEAPGSPTPPSFDAPVSPPPVPPLSVGGMAPRITRLVLSKAARRLVVLFIVLGALFYATGAVASIVLADQFDTAADEFLELEERATENSARYVRETQSCALEGGLPCLKQANARLADSIARSRNQLNDIEFPAQALDEADDLDAVLLEFESRLRQLADAPDAPSYQAGLADLQRFAGEVTFAELALARALNIRVG
jgi:hypothetical protein